MRAEQQPVITPDEARAIAKEAYIYGFPLVDSYRIQYSYFVDRSSPEYKAPWNTIVNNAARLHARRQGDPDAQLGHALLLGRRGPARRAAGAHRAADREGALLLAAVHRLYTFNFAYVGSRATGNEGGQLPARRAGLEGRDAQGHQGGDPLRDGIRLRPLSDAALQPGRHRQREEGSGRLQGRSRCRRSWASRRPPPRPPIDFIKPLTRRRAERTSLEFFNILNFVLQFCPTHPSEKALMARFAKIGVGAGKTVRRQRALARDAQGDRGRHGRRLGSLRRSTRNADSTPGKRTQRRRFRHARVS